MLRSRSVLLRSCLALALWAWTSGVCAQEFPTVTYTTSDGLPHDIVARLLQDSRGFLWVGGVTALARFDGERFTSYGRADGLDVGTGINDMKLGEDREIWLATNGAGVYRFDVATPDRAARFKQFPVGDVRATNRVNVITPGSGGHLWAGTDAGLFIGALDRPFQRVLLPVPGVPPDAVMITAIVSDGSWMWVATTFGVYRCPFAPPFECRPGPPGRTRALLLMADGYFWVARDDDIELWRMDVPSTPASRQRVVAKGVKPRRLLKASDGIFAITDNRQVVAIRDGSLEVVFMTAAASRFNDLIEDASHNLWVATNGGLIAIQRQGVTLFSTHPGLRQPLLRTVRRDQAGRVYALTEEYSLHRVGAGSVTSVRLAVPPGVRKSVWAVASVHIDSRDDVWLGTAAGLYRFSRPVFTADPPATVKPAAVFTTSDGLSGDHVADLFEDASGDLWIGSMPGGPSTLTVWRRQTGRFERFGEAEGVPAFSQPLGFIQDTHGAVWARLREGGVIRVREGRVSVFGPSEGLPAFVTAMLVDHTGALWIGGADVVVRVTDPAASPIRAVPAVSGLGSTPVVIVEDSSHRLYAGTFEGLISWDPGSGVVRRFSTFEGVPRGNVETLFVSPDGALVGIIGRTVVRLTAVAPRLTEPPRCVLSAVRIGGRAFPLPEIGLERIDAVEVPPARNQIEIEFLAVSRRFGERLAYEYRLSGISGEWTRASERRVTYAGLASGLYTFEVRAAAADGTTMSAPATFRFTVLPPWYLQWWFLTAAVAAGLFAAYAGHRAKLAQALRTERLRSRIATDLHDDIGSSLSQIAILAEVARRRAGTQSSVAEPLASIATTSRDLVDSMSDIVWAVNPRTDSLSDLSRRMHRFAEETLGGADIALAFSAPPADLDLKLGADLRRELYLILKESVNNIARHSGASRASVELNLVRYELWLTVVDDGRGFDTSASVDGNGIMSMKKRASAFGGALTIDSAPGRGTRVSLRADVRRA
jgi:signal transduction histidine kinase/ligand-binding sensor domain-containing protein